MDGMETRFLSRREGLLSEDFEDGLVICDPVSEQVVHLNPMAAAIWDMCDGAASAEDIVLVIAEAFPAVDLEQVRQDVRNVLGGLRAKGFVIG